MALNVSWINDDQTILCFDAQGEWTWEDCDALIDEAFAAIRELGHVVHIIVMAGQSFPLGARTPHLQRIIASLPANIGLVVVANGHGSMRPINDAIMKINPRLANKVIWTGSVEEAFSLLNMSEMVKA
jgi:hypothetical protein